MNSTYQRTLVRKLSDYLPVAEEIETFCAQHDLPKAVHARVRVVLEELILNQIDHATGALTDRIDLRIDIEPRRVLIVVEDDADPFDPHSAPAFDKTRPLEQRGPRGMGLQLVRSMTEAMDYERVGSRNRLQVAISREPGTRKDTA
jgi:anti-sigma regulatory factor (Ser/Thr protein kinase)